MTTLEEMKLAVCGKLNYPCDKNLADQKWQDGRWINWPTEGLQVCHEAEKLLTDFDSEQYICKLDEIQRGRRVWKTSEANEWNITHATYEQRLEALCRVWFPKEFDTRKIHER